MINEVDQIQYACISKSEKILAEYFNSKDASLSSLAQTCLSKTPPFHSYFTHTVRSQTYTFLIEPPFVFFAIFDQNLDKSLGLSFLKSVRDAFVVGDDHNPVHDFYPVFRNRVYGVRERRNVKDRILGKFEERNVEFSTTRNVDYKNENCLVRGKRVVWKKQVWIVLIFDLIVCFVLFTVWLLRLWRV